MDTPSTPTRREVLRRGAIVGGALVWTTPVVQSIGGRAFAAGSEIPAGTLRAATVTIGRSSGNVPFDSPVIGVTNNSDAGVLLTRFTLTIGDTTFNYDRVIMDSMIPGGTATLNSPDRVNGGVRSDVLDYSFTGFDRTVSFRTQVDIDPDTGNSNNTDFRTILFNNGSAPNAVATFTFNSGSPLSVTLTDRPPGQNSYSFSVSN